MICRAATKVKISGGIAIRLPMAMAMTLPQSTPISVMNSEAATGLHQAIRRNRNDGNSATFNEN